MRVLTDFHHSSLLRSLIILFEDRLGMELYRPIGEEWFEEGFWKVYDHPATVKQFLSLDQSYKPVDGTPQLNQIVKSLPDGCYLFAETGGLSHKACTLEYFKNNTFDYVIASMPEHVEPFKRLIAQYMPNAKLIVQLGNNWNMQQLAGMNVLASIGPRGHDGVNAIFYHQEFDLKVFYPSPVVPNGNIYSFINILQNFGSWHDFQVLEQMTPFNWKSYGGQCRDGSVGTPFELADKMREAMLIFHVKPGGDGFGHVIHNAFAVGRPVITRSSHYKNCLAENLLTPETCIDLDAMDIHQASERITHLWNNPDDLAAMGSAAYKRFKEVVDFDTEAEQIKQWLTTLV